MKCKNYTKNGLDIRKIHGIIKDTLIICLGLMISSFGISLFYEAGMGSGAMATFCDGLHNIIPLTYGQANMIANVILLIVLIICDRKFINVGTILCVFAIGPFVDLGTMLFSKLSIGDMSFVIRLLCVLIGTFMMGVGLALYVAVDRGYGALEGLVKFACRKTKIKFGTAKIIQDLLLIAMGLVFSAAWGIGTIIAAVLTGPIIQVSIPVFEKILKKN